MAKSIASLFGPSAEEIVYAQQEAGKQRQQQQLQNTLAAYQDPMARQFYQSGYNIASGAGGLLGGLFGDTPMADPRLTKNLKLRKILGSSDVEDLNNPDKLKTLSASLAKAGLMQESMYFSDRAISLATSAYERDFKERKLEAEYGATKPTDYRVLNDDGSISNVEQRGKRYFNSTTGEEITDFSLVRKSNELKASGEAKPATKLRLRGKFLKDSDFDPKVKDQIAQDISERANGIFNANRGAIEMSEAEEQAYDQMVKQGVIVEPKFLGGRGARLNPFSNWEYNPTASFVEGRKDISVADPEQSIKRQQAKERGLSETWNQGITTKQIRQTPDGKVFEILVDVNGNVTYERELK
tara:strand:+ start:599 stop:1663 length:1065 start_codon:yes stop_codon:yes gene_type:complete